MQHNQIYLARKPGAEKNNNISRNNTDENKQIKTVEREQTKINKNKQERITVTTLRTGLNKNKKIRT